MEGKLIKFSSKEEVMWTKKLDDRDMEVLEEALLARLDSFEHAINAYHEHELEEDVQRLKRMLGLIYMEVEDETN